MSITISHPSAILKGSVTLPASKSESNRILIIEALSKGEITTANLSDARDTKLLQTALKSTTADINILDAGTAMRFLTAYYCAAGQHKILTGSERMQERPIGILVEALREIGFDIRYVGRECYPPLEIMPTDLSTLKNEVSIAGNISSQYISALLMIAPVLPHGLTIRFTSEIASKPYIMLTLDLLTKAGIKHVWDEEGIKIEHQNFQQTKLRATADWSAASYWFSMAALARETNFKINNLTLDSAQGDKIMAAWADRFDLNIHTDTNGIYLVSKNSVHSENPLNSDLLFDFTDHPDLAQTIIVLCAARNMKATFSGLQSLRIKETDRILALQNELRKFGVSLEEFSTGNFTLSGHFQMSDQSIKTYNDHRMAMAFAPFALLGQITIEEPEVVEKSYPDFWKEMERMGFQIN